MSKSSVGVWILQNSSRMCFRLIFTFGIELGVFTTDILSPIQSSPISGLDIAVCFLIFFNWNIIFIMLC